MENKLFVKAKKCDFHIITVYFLGYVITQGQVQMDNTKVTAVTEWPSPTTLKQLHWFLGFAHFYLLLVTIVAWQSHSLL